MASLLVPAGHLVVTEVCWTQPEVPPACAAFWTEEYPAIRDVSTQLGVIDECGYDVVDHFTLPPSSWWDSYYEPLQRSLGRFRDRHAGEADSQGVSDHVQREIDIWHAYSAFYSYVFFVMRVR